MEILVAEDDRIYRQALTAILEGAGHVVRLAPNGRKALALFRAQRPELVLLDVMMPVMDGFTACQEIRRLDPSVPVLFLTAKDAEADELRGRGLGADDYIPKAVSDAVLLARLASVFRRCVPRDVAARFVFGGWTVDPGRMSMSRVGCRSVNLTERELALLNHFSSHPEETFSKDWLLMRFWGADSACGEGAVSTALHTLRAKLGPSSECLETVWGRGVRYRLQVNRLL